jgi:leucyl aminopeptidase
VTQPWPAIEIVSSPEPALAQHADVLIVPRYEGDERAPEGLEAVWQQARDDRFKGGRGATYLGRAAADAPAPRVCFVGIGKRDAWSPQSLRGDLVAALKTVSALGVQRVVFDLAALGEHDAATLAQFGAEGALYGAHRFDGYKKKKDDDADTVKTVVLAGRELPDPALARGVAIGSATCRAREWVGQPPNVCTPAYLAQHARELATEYDLELTLFEGLEALEAERMGLHAAVAQGSVHAPAFIHLTYRGESTGANPARKLAFVGKGVTFDSGGYSIKPSSGQIGMQADMAGGAAVLAAAQAVGAIRPADAVVHFIIPCAENMVSDRAYRVNDVIFGRSGKSVEITNTDAEGRLLLADALTYATELGVDAVFDIATLTGGCVVTFAGIHAAVLGNKREITRRFLELGEQAGEAFWELPLTDRLKKTLSSPVADLQNTGGRWGSTTTGALFLSEFVGETPWVHVDMAGLEIYEAAWEHMPKGPTGFGVATLTHLACHF